MYTCAEIGHISAVELLHRLGADINRATDYGRTAVFAAASGGYRKVIKLLASLGADIDRADNEGVCEYMHTY